MFNPICVLNVRNQACQKVSLALPCLLGGPKSWDFCATRAVCVQSCCLEHSSVFHVMPWFSGIVTKETAEPWIDCRNMSWESHPELPAHMLCCWLTFPGRAADRGDHEHSKELWLSVQAPFLSFVVSHAARLLFWSSWVRLLISLACMHPKYSPETCDMVCNSHWDWCRGFSLWNVGNEIFPHFFKSIKDASRGEGIHFGGILTQPGWVSLQTFRLEVCSGIPMRGENILIHVVKSWCLLYDLRTRCAPVAWEPIPSTLPRCCLLWSYF